MSTNDGGPAFPAWELNGHGQQEMTCFGMSLRDYFAAKAMPALLAEYCASAKEDGFAPDWRVGVALDAYAMADAMLEARATGQESPNV